MEFVNSAQAAAIIGVSDQTFLNWIKKGRVDGVLRVGRVWLIPRSSLDNIEPPKQGRPRKKKVETLPPPESKNGRSQEENGR